MKTKNLFSALLAVMMIFAFSLGIAALDPVFAQAAAITVNLGEAVWGGGQNEGGWTKTANENGSVTVKQASGTTHNRYDCGTDLILDGLSLEVNFKNESAVAIGQADWACYVTDVLTLKVAPSGERSWLMISRKGTEEDAKFYPTADDALAMTETGTWIDGAKRGAVLFEGTSPTIRFDFKRYSTRRYQLTVTSEQMYSGMSGKQDNSVTYYLNTEDYTNLFRNSENQCVRINALGNSAGNAEMTISAVQGEENTNIIEDGVVLNPALNAMLTETVTVTDGKKLVTFTDDDISYNPGTDSVAEVKDNGTVFVNNPYGTNWGSRTGMNKNLLLDGLKITVYNANCKSGKLVSVILGDSPLGYYNNGNLCVVERMQEDNQPRLYIGSSHNVTGGNFTSYMHKTLDGAKANSNDDRNSCIIFEGSSLKYSIEFNKVEEAIYKITIKLLNQNETKFHWAQGCTDEEKANGVVYYLNVNEIQSITDEGESIQHLFTADGYVMLSTATAYEQVGSQIAYYVETPLSTVLNAEINLEKEDWELVEGGTVPVITEVKADGVVVTADCYDVEYRNNTTNGVATMIIKFKNGYNGVFTRNYNVIGKNASEAVVTLEYTTTEYTTFANEPAVTLVKLGEEVIPASDYTVSYKNNINVGTAKVVVTFMNNYSGTAEASFEITKIQQSEEGEDITLELADVSEAKVFTLGNSYIYTITDAEGNEINVSEMKAGTYNVLAVKESSTTVKKVTYTVTVNPAQESAKPVDSGSSADSGCFGSVGLGSSIISVLGLAAVFALFRKKEEK